MSKRIFFLTKVGAFESNQFMHIAEDLHELCVDILQVMPARPGHEYTDAQVIKFMQQMDTWENTSYYLISEFIPATSTLIELVKDTT